MDRARLIESSLLTGFVLISLPFVPGFPHSVGFRTELMLLAASVLLFSSIYAFNSYFGFAADRLNPRLKDRQYETSGRYLLRGCLFTLASLPLFYAIQARLVPIAVLIVLLWMAYNVPGGAKARPLWGTAVHFVGQVLQFHLGILATGSADARSLAASVFFALLFSSGHIMHELKDHAPDRTSGIRTNAVAFGPKRTVFLYRVICVLSCGYWAAVYAAGLVSLRLFVPFLAASGAHAVTALAWSSASLRERSGNQRFQLVYRIYYVIAGGAAFLIGS